jgi:hypothetical protein
MSFRKRVLFLYRPGIHHLFHSLYIAIEFSKIQNEYEVSILNTSLDMHKIIKAEIQNQSAKIKYINRSLLFSVLNKSYHKLIKSNKAIIRESDVILTASWGIPRLLQKYDLRDRCVIYTRHGANIGDNEYKKGLPEYDCVFITSNKMYDQLKELSILSKLKSYIKIDYCKFDYLFKNTGIEGDLFKNDLPVILYNPHFQNHRSSLFRDGEKIIDEIVKSNKFNVILSPHPLVNKWHFFKRIKLKFPKSDKLIIDWSSIHQVNFDYMRKADIYLGDTSSSIYEWLYFDKPMIFYNSHNVDWEDKPFFDFWHWGYVVNNLEDLTERLNSIIKGSDPFKTVRRENKNYVFGEVDGKASYRTALKLYRYLKENNI